MEVEPEIIVEEGEITDDSDVEYTPLERPPTLLNNHRPQIQETFTDEESENEESDSDSDNKCSLRPKRTKLKIKHIAPKPTHRPKKYDVWSSRVQEDVLAETLISCDVSKIDRSRCVESYDYTLSKRYKDSCKAANKHKGNERKRKATDRTSVKLRLGNKKESTDETKGVSRTILELTSTIDEDNDKLAKEIANKLCEEKDDLIRRVVDTLGKKKSIDLFNHTRRIEEDGGMLIMNGTRRRTPGGVYIFLLKRDDDVSMIQQNTIFSEEKRLSNREHKRKDRAKVKCMKNKIHSATRITETLPELPTRAELCAQEAVCKEIVDNPPPSPASEEHEITVQPIAPATSDRDHNNYNDDFLDIGIGNDMDMF